MSTAEPRDAAGDVPIGDAPAGDAPAGDGRNETETERLDRNWDEILQELRVTQTGTQVLTGFLLTVAFQQRFQDLDDFQVGVYLVLVVLAVLTTALALAPVSLHRTLFRQRAKVYLVKVANVILRIVLAGVAAVLGGTVLLIFDFVAGRTAGLVVGTVALAVMVVLAVALPIGARRHPS